MNQSFKLSFLLCLFLLSGSLSLSAKCVPQPDFKKEINALSKLLEATKADLASLRKEVEAIKNQKCTVSSECLGRIEEQQRRLADSKEIESVLIKYGNNPEGMSALHYAIKQGDANVVNLLIANSADVNSKDGNFTTLTRAAISNQFEIAQILLNSGADVNFTTNNNGPFYALYYAAQFGSADMIRLLVDHGAKLDRITPDCKDTTPLHVAVEAGNYEAVVAFVNVGANIGANFSEVEHWGCNPLDVAASKLTFKDNPKNLELVKFLVENGARRKRAGYQAKCPVIDGYLQSVGR